MAAISTFESISAALAESAIGPFAQELFILAVFGASYVAWRFLGRQRRSGQRRQPKCVDTPPYTASSGAGTRRVPETLRRRPASPMEAVRVPVVPPGDSQSNAGMRGLEKQLMKHLDHQEFTQALNLYRSLERDGRDLGFSEELYAAFVQSAVRVGKVDVVERMLRIMFRQGMTPTLAFWQSLLKLLSSRKNFTACLAIYSHFAKHIPTDKVLYSCLINAALESGDPHRAAPMLERYRETDLEPKDYMTFFRTYQAMGDADAAVALLQELGGNATTLMFNLVLLTCVHAKQPERGLTILREEIQGASEERKPLADVVSYNTIIKGFARSNLQQCFECLQDMTSNGIDPDDITWGTLLDACLVDRQLDTAAKLIDMLLADGRPMDGTMCTLFIKGLARAGCVDKALELLAAMRRRGGACPDIVTYTYLIKALVDRHELDGAMLLLEEMRAAGHKSDDIVVTHLLEGCRHACNHQLGKRLFKELLLDGVKPSEFTLVSMLKLHGRCGAHGEAFEMVQSWEKSHGSKPSVIHYTCLMSGCIRTRTYAQAWAAYELMCKNGVEPDAMMLSTLLPAMVSAQRWDAVAELAAKATAGGRSAVPAEHLNAALAQMKAAGGQGRFVESLRVCMQAAGVAVTARQPAREPPIREARGGCAPGGRSAAPMRAPALRASS